MSYQIPRKTLKSLENRGQSENPVGMLNLHS